MDNQKEFKQPGDVVAVNINPENGKIATKIVLFL